MPTITITCPHCGFAKETDSARVPLRDLQVTCPRCKQGFPFSRADRSPGEAGQTGSAVPTATANGTNPAQFAQPRTFFVKLPLRLLLSATPLLMLGMPLCLPFTFSQLPTEGAITLASFFCLLLALTGYCAWKYWQPALILTGEGIEYPLANPFKPVSLPWNRIQGITMDVRTVSGKPKAMARLILAPDSRGVTEVVIGLHVLEGGEKAAALLKQMIPEKRTRDFAAELLRFTPVSTETLQYRTLEITREGIVCPGGRGGKQRIAVPWDRIDSIKTEGYVIAGYGSITVYYLDKGGTNRLEIRAATSERYHDCIKLLIANAKNAALDPGVMAILEYPVASARADMGTILLVCTGIVMAIAGLLILSFYPPTIASTWLYPLLLLPLCAAPFAWTLKLLSSRFMGGGAAPSRKLAAASLFNIGTLLAIMILFALSPASLSWLLADTNALLGRMEQAEAHYLQAEPALAGNGDFLFSLGQFYARKQEWHKSSRYYIRAYEKDPTNWMLQPLLKIPDSLCRAGQYAEALHWCDRISGQYGARRDIVRTMEKKKQEIRSTMPATTGGAGTPAAATSNK